MSVTKLGAACVWMALCVRAVSAQSTGLSTLAVSPTNLLLPNYHGVPVGEVGGLEAGAFLVRANDSSAIFYNPAALTRAEKTSVSGTAGMFQFGSLGAESLGVSSTSFQQVPAMFALVLKDVRGRSNLSAGLSVARTNAWIQSVDFERTTQSVSGVDRLSYSSDGRLDSWLGSFGVGYSTAGKWRAGISLDGQYTSADRRQSLADQYRASDGFTATSFSARTEAGAMHLRFTLGGKYDVTPRIAAGIVLRSQGVRIYSTGLSLLEAQAATPTATTTASFFDDTVDVTYKIPFEFKTGVAYKGRRAQAEIDLLINAGSGQYALYKTTEPVTIVSGSSSTGSTPSAIEYPATPPVIHSQAIVNVAIGGQMNLTDSGSWTVHAGYSSDRSPVGPNDTVFTKVNLQKLTGGISARTSRFVGSVGLQYLAGTSDPLVLRDLPAGVLTTIVAVHNFGLVYSLSVTF